MTVRQLAKRAIERLLLLAPRSPRRMRGRALVLAYHNVVPDGLEGRGDASLHLPLGEFVGQVSLLQAQCRILPLEQVLGGARSDDGAVVAITFDDAYRGAVELALPELARRGLPATMFVAPGLLGAASFWWDEFADGSGEIPRAVRNRVLDIEAGRPGHTTAGPRLPVWYQCAAAEQLDTAARQGALTFGAHTWTHPNLTRLHADDLAMELTQPLAWLRASALRMVPVLSYPYGLSSPAVERAAADAGYDCALRVDGGWLAAGGSRWALPRFNVPAGLSLDGFRLRLSGMLPA